MELGLSLGEASKPLKFLENSSRKPKTSLDFCMGLGLKTYSVVGNEERANKIQENDIIIDCSIAEGENSDENNNQELNLLPRSPVPRRISVPWSSGSSENGSSGNVGRAAAANRLPAEEVTSANSVRSGLHLDFGVVGGKRGFEAARGNDVVEVEMASSRASDDDENGLNNRKKLRLSKEQSAFLEESFKEHNTLNPKQKVALAKQLNLRARQVEVWFQNRRARTKLKQTEVDCEYLKRCCERLSDENRRLQKELQELRALKNSNPFYMQLPATTLTMCPSCERVAATTAAAGKTDVIPKAVAQFPMITNRPSFFPFSQKSVHPNQPAAS